jgi:uncharacterized membrane protein YfcA
MTILLYITVGLCIGSISGTLGIGGGVLLVPILIWLCGFDTRKATGTSLAILVPPIGLPAALYAYRKGQVDLDAALWIAGAFMVGAFGSRALVEYLPEQLLRLLFGLLMIYIGVRFVVSSDSEAANVLAALMSVTFALLALLFLRWLGRQHLPPPDLGDEIERMHREGRGDPEYYI